MPVSSMRSSRISPGAMSSGADSGRSTATGCGSNVTATDGRPSRCPDSMRAFSTAR